MKKTIYIISVLFFLIGLTACSSNTKNNEPNYFEAAFKIDGMVCEHGCKSVIEKELIKTDGILSFVIDFEKATATTVFDKNKISSEKIITTIEQLNNNSYNVNLIEEHQQINAREEVPKTVDQDQISLAV